MGLGEATEHVTEIYPKIFKTLVADDFTSVDTLIAAMDRGVKSDVSKYSRRLLRFLATMVIEAHTQGDDLDNISILLTDDVFDFIGYKGDGRSRRHNVKKTLESIGLGHASVKPYESIGLDTF